MYAKWPPHSQSHVYKYSWSLVPRLMTYDPLSFLTSARLLCYLTVGMGCWFANICMCLWRYFPVLWRLTRISDAIWITMECSCLDIDIHLLDKCAGRWIKIDVKVSHFGMFSRADLCTLDMQHFITGSRLTHIFQCRNHMIVFPIKTITWLRHRTAVKRRVEILSEAD